MEAQLQASIAAARAAWPRLAIEPRAFADYVAARLPAGAVLDGLHLVDLYLACGCAARQPAALEHLEAAFLGQLPAFLSGIDRSPSFVDKVGQALREHLLVGRAGRAAAIADYAGRGPLGRWLRVAAQRIALNLRRGLKGHATLDDDGHAALGNPELEVLRKAAQGELAVALRSALAALTPRERNLLRLHFLDGLTTTEIAALLRVHRTTVRRQLNECRDALVARVRADLRARLHLSDSQLESIIRDAVATLL
jgi:RNA polymerase sigma-70 factor (ECF subfamily)